MLDISDIRPNGKSYNGNTKKSGITYNGIDYIVKFPKSDDMSVYCEYIASELICSIGVPCHKVELGIYNGTVVAIIQDFTSGTKLTLHSYKDTKQSSEDTDIGDKEYTYDDVIYLIDKHLKMSDSDKTDAQNKFWDMFICDAIIGNRDRHWGNWGYLNNGNGYKFAPLYDNGAGLYPGINKVIDQYMEAQTREKFIYDRVFVFPASLFKVKRPDRSYRSNYAEIFKDLSINRVFADRVRRMRQNIGYGFIFNSMLDICKNTDLSWKYCRFFTEIATMRYMCIILRLDFNKAYNMIEGELLKHDQESDQT